MIDTKKLGLVAIITACVFWGGSFYLGKIALQEIPAVQVVWWRFMLATLALVPMLGILVIRRRSQSRKMEMLRIMPRMSDLPLFILNALVMVPMQFVLQFEGLARTTASSAALLVGSFAPMMALAGVFISRESLHTKGWLAVASSSLGVILIVGLPGAGGSLSGDLMVVASLMCAVGMVLVTQRLIRRYEVLTVTVWSIGLGVLMLLPWVYHVSGWPVFSLRGSTWGALIGLALGCTAAAFSLWNWGLRYIPASRAGVYVNLEPLLGAMLGVMLLHESVTSGLIAGGTLILGAALLISWPQQSTALVVAEG